MRETLTISMPDSLRKDIRRAAKNEGVTESEYVRRAVKADMFRRSLRATRQRLAPLARAQGIYTDDDAFDAVS